MTEPTSDKMKAWELIELALRDSRTMIKVMARANDGIAQAGIERNEQALAALQQLRPDDVDEFVQNELVELKAMLAKAEGDIAKLDAQQAVKPPQTVPDGDDVGVWWMLIETAPKGGRVFISRDKTKPWITFEAAIFAERESWEIPQRYYVIQNMTTDEPIDDDWSHLEWKPLPAPPAAAMSKVGE